MLDLGMITLFHGLEFQQQKAILAMARQLRVTRASHLFFEHEQATTLYVLLSGWIRLFKLAPDGRQSVTRFVGPYEIVGISALVPDGIYRLTAQTASPCRMLAWKRDDLMDMTEHYPYIRENALRLMSRYLDDLQQQYLELATERVEQRIAHALVRIAERYGAASGDEIHIGVPLSQRDLADLVGVTHYTVSRILRLWSAQAIVVTGRAHIHIRNLPQLIARAELLSPKSE